MNYTVHIESLHKNFPENFTVPALLLDFGSWLQSQREGSLGYFSLQSARFNDYWIENGADLHPNFAFFMRSKGGDQIGYWLYDGIATISPPIVLVGSEGKLKILSDTLKEFLQQLATGNTTVSDLDSHKQGTQEEADLANWLQTHLTPKSNRQHSLNHPDITQWMKNWGQQQRDFINQNPHHLQIADKLRPYLKPNAQPWETTNFDVLLVGKHFKMWHRSFGLKPLPADEIADLETLFRSIREQRAQKFPERGLWFSAWVTVGTKGGAVLCCNFLDRPKFLDHRPMIPSSDYQQDMRDFPRSKHWMPEWLPSSTTGS